VIRNKELELEAAKKLYTLAELGYSGGNIYDIVSYITFFP
jgi:hypothetical protein